MLRTQSIVGLSTEAVRASGQGKMIGGNRKDARAENAFLERLLSAKSINQVNKLALEFQTSFMPRDAGAVLRAYRIANFPALVRGLIRFLFGSLGWLLRRSPRFPQKNCLEAVVGARKFLLSWRRQFDQASVRGENDFERLEFAPSVTLYRSSVNAKDLLIAFPPRGGNFGITNAIFLEVAAAAAYDVLLVVPNRNEEWPWTEVNGVAGGFPGFVRAVSEGIEGLGYQRVHTMGYSFGAAMSFFAGVALGANSVTPIALTIDLFEPGSVYSDLWSQKAFFDNPHPLVVGNRLKFVVGGLSEEDIRVARSMSERLSGSLTISVRGGSHAALGPIIESGQLKDFLLAIGSTPDHLVSSNRRLTGVDVLASSEARGSI